MTASLAKRMEKYAVKKPKIADELVKAKERKDLLLKKEKKSVVSIKIH